MANFWQQCIRKRQEVQEVCRVRLTEEYLKKMEGITTYKRTPGARQGRPKSGASGALAVGSTMQGKRGGCHKQNEMAAPGNLSLAPASPLAYCTESPTFPTPNSKKWSARIGGDSPTVARAGGGSPGGDFGDCWAGNAVASRGIHGREMRE
jgi:hypothetical protein